MNRAAPIEGQSASSKKEFTNFFITQETKQKIEIFLRQSLHLELNPDKTRIISTNKGADLLGYKIFYFYRLIRKRNLKAFKAKLKLWQEEHRKRSLSASKLGEKIRGWISYAECGNSYNLRKRLLSGITFKKNYQGVAET